MAEPNGATSGPVRVSVANDRDEIDHVAFGWRWLTHFKAEDASAWDTYRSSLDWPLRPAKARGRRFHRSGRRAAGLDDEFIDRLEAAPLDA